MEKERLIYETLGLPYPGNLKETHSGFLNLGGFAPNQLGPEATIKVMDRYIALIEKLINSDVFLPENEELLKGYNFPTYRRYERMFRGYHGFMRENRSAEGLIKSESRDIKKELAQRHDPFQGKTLLSVHVTNILRHHFKHLNKATLESYCQLLQTEGPPIRRFFDKPLPFLMEQSKLERHVLLTGNSGAGKSTLLKRLVHVCAEDQSASVVVLDPAGNLVRELAEELPLSAERLIYLDPQASKDHTPVLNPLDLKHRDENTIHLAVEDLLGTFEELLKGGSGADLTNNMYALLYPCLSVLMKMGGQTLMDLQRFLQNDPDLINLGCTNDNPSISSFFKTAFMEKKYDPTKIALYTKLQSLLNSPIFNRMVARPHSSIDLEAEVSSGKIILVNAAKGAMGEQTSEALGRFLVASLGRLVEKRVERNQVIKPIFLIIDEVQNYLSPSLIKILRESRKFGLHLVAATQYITDMDHKMQDAFLSVTNVKMTGMNAYQTLTTMSRETGAPLEELQRLRLGHFSMKVDTAKPVTVMVPPPPQKPEETSAKSWKAFIEQQVTRYYKTIKEKPKPKEEEPAPEPEAEPEEPKQRKAALEL